jgi:hypothetical protein
MTHEVKSVAAYFLGILRTGKAISFIKNLNDTDSEIR